MTTLKKIDAINNYFVDKVTKELILKYDPDNPNLQLVLEIDGSRLIVDASKINVEYGNQIVVKYMKDKFIIDDGYQNVLVKAGYIVYKNYDEERVFDREKGVALRESIMETYQNAVSKINMYEPTDTGFKNDKYEFTINIDSINSMVNKNQQRKDNSLAFYPFDKNMDKYGTIYISIFVKKLSDRPLTEVEGTKHTIANQFIRELMTNMGEDYHFCNMQIKRRLLYADKL